MEALKTLPIQNQNSYSKIENDKLNNPPEKIKNGKKKLVLALGGLAIAGIITAGIIYKTRKGKVLGDIKSAMPKKVPTAQKNPEPKPINSNPQRRKYKQNGVNITEFYDGDTLIKRTTSQAFPEQKYVRIKTECPNGKYQDEYFVMGNRNKGIIIKDRLGGNYDTQTLVGVNPNRKYGISHDGLTRFADDEQQVQGIIDEMGLPFKINNLGATRESRVRFIKESPIGRYGQKVNLGAQLS